LDEDVKKVTFTGSAAVGWRLKAPMPKKRFTLELGGNAGVIVHEDADFEFAVKRCVAGSFGYAGQTCISIQRIYVHEPLYERFKEAFVEGVKALKLGDPLDPQTQVGPMITPSALEGTLSFIEEAISRGARLLAGGKRRENILEPTVLENVEPSMRVVCEEAFAPVVNLIPYVDFEEALAMVNDSAYGLQAGVFTSDIARVFQAYETLEVGGVIQGDASNFRVDPMPYGGVKDSGFGREGVRFAIEEMTEPKLLVLNTKAGIQEGLAEKTPPGE
jgi:glyceraldehyde-3-phosphate dehydrogenase (NADP+)